MKTGLGASALPMLSAAFAFGRLLLTSLFFPCMRTSSRVEVDVEFSRLHAASGYSGSRCLWQQDLILRDTYMCPQRQARQCDQGGIFTPQRNISLEAIC